MAKEPTVIRHTWDGEASWQDVDGTVHVNTELEAQLALPVHFSDGSAERMKPTVINGRTAFQHFTMCGIEIGTAILRTTDDAAEVTCPDCT